jgi:hypothetical protein
LALDARLFPQLTPRCLLKAFTWLKPSSRRAPVDRHLGVEHVERRAIVNVEQEEALLGIQDE